MNDSGSRINSQLIVHPLNLIAALVTAALLCPAPSQAAQAEQAATPSGQAQDLDEVTVTGQVPPGAVVGDIPPENQLRPADIASYGVSTINDLLSEISDQTQSDQGRSSSTAPIILVNGKRVSGVNEVGDLPTEAILRVDILPEEVALKYGYGAQQKVVNIILRRFFRATVVDANGGGSTDGGAATATADLNYSRIRDNDRVNVVGRVKSRAEVRESDRGVSSTAGAIVDPTGTLGGDSNARTLLPATDTYSLNGVVAHTLSDSVSASFNLMASYQTSRALLGFPSADLAIPASSPYAQSEGDTTLERFLSNATLRQAVDTGTAHGGITLNVDLPRKWRLSVIGSFDYSDAHTWTDRGYDVQGLQAAVNAGAINPYGSLPLSALGPLLRQDATAITHSGSVSAVVNGALFKLAAGDVATSVRLSGDLSNLDAAGAGSTARNTTRSQPGAQISVDVPLTSRSNHVLGALGDLSANVTGAVTQVSGFGALSTLGYGLHWTPRTGISLLASINEDHQVPTLSQLDNPLVTTPNVRVYDYVQGRTVTVLGVSGGNPALQADDRHVFKLNATVAAINTAKTKLNLTANYFVSSMRNGIGALSTATAATEEAFPDRFERDGSGSLVAVDGRAVNFARQDRRSVRWGFNLTQVLRAPTRPARPPGAAPFPARGGQAARFDGQRIGHNARAAGSGANTGSGVAVTSSDAAAENAGGPPTAAAAAGNGPDEVVVTGARPGAVAASGPPMPPPGEVGRGGFGPAGGRGGGHGGAFGGGNGAQLEVSLYHSWYFQDDVRLSATGPVVDLLNGGTIGAGGQARHSLQLNGGVIDNGIGLRVSGVWTSPIGILDAGGGSGALYYSSLTTLNLRLFANLQQRLPGKPWARGTRVTLSVSNIFNARQSIRDASGATPQIYQPAFLDPIGRTIGIAFRRLF